MPQSAPICHNCTKKYSKDPPTIPILLNCGHTFCEGCITRFGRLIKGKGNITCPDCAEYHYIESLKSIKQLQINAHIYGIITAPNRKTENAVDTMVQHNDLTSKLTDLARQQSSDEEESEVEDKDDYTPCCECKGRSTLQCKDCGSLPYCTACSDRAHKLVALQSHRPEPIKPKSLFDQCQFHPDSIPTQCREHDGKPVCPQCPSTGETLDLVCEPDQIDDLIQKHNLALEKLEETDQNIATDLIPMVEQDFVRLKSEVRKEFGYFHGVLQAREQASLGALDDAQSKTTESLLNYRSEIVKTKKTARKNFNWIQRHKHSKNALIEKQSEVQSIKKGIESMKCTLIVQSEKRPTLSTKKGMLARCINEFCKLNIDDVHNYNMDTVNSTAAIKEEQVSLFPPPVENESLNMTQLSVTSQPSEPLTVQFATAENKDKVIVSVVNTPHCFYVQKTKDRNDLDELQNVLVKYYGLSVTAEDYLTSVTTGDLVCCKFTVDGFWYRARVQETDNTSANVLYIDYGNSELVSVGRLRRLKTQFTHCPAMAIQCSLFGITPRTGSTWTDEAVDSFRSLTGENEFEMVTMGKCQECAEVDLLRIGGDIGSTREFLVFLEHACFSVKDKMSAVEDEAEEEIIVELDTVQVEPTPLLWPESGEEYTLVTVPHIDSPHQFYIQFSHNSETLQDIGQRTSSHMKLAGKKFPLKELKKGVMCLALFPGDGAYYRAVIMGAVGFDVQVFYCDYGNNDKVARSELYEIPRTLASPPQQSLTCSLFGVAPKEGGWTRTAVVIFEQLVAARLIFAGLHCVQQGRCQVSLIDTTLSNEDVEIADELIGRGFGISTQPPAKPQQQQRSSVPMGEISLGVVNSTRETTICHVTNPHMIYVNRTDIPYPPFFKQLNTAYSRLVKTGNQVIERETSWSIGDICVAYLPDLDLYIRAKILSFEMPQSVGVINIDQGRESKVSLNNLKVLIADFSLIRVSKFALSCRLFDIVPLDDNGFTRDQNKKVLRFFSKKIKKSKAGCFVTIMGERDPGTGAWPVDMVLIDPADRTRERVSDELVKLGVAQFITNKVAAPKGEYKQVELSLLERLGKVIHVSSNCTIYFKPDSMRPDQERLAASLESFQGTPANVDWEVGSACVAKSDKWYFRGVITHLIGPKILEILMVDTGIAMNVHVKDVFPILLCPDIPKLAIPLKLAYIEPAWHCTDGVNWGQPAKAFLYEQVVNERCEIDVVKDEGEFHSVSMKLTSGQDVGKIMVRKGFAISCSPHRSSPASSKTPSTLGPGTPTSPLNSPLQFGALPQSPGTLPPTSPLNSPLLLPPSLVVSSGIMSGSASPARNSSHSSLINDETRELIDGI